eukprot:7319835-Alexandrium_andersonii.AAC.1
MPGGTGIVRLQAGNMLVVCAQCVATVTHTWLRYVRCRHPRNKLWSQQPYWCSHVNPCKLDCTRATNVSEPCQHSHMPQPSTRSTGQENLTVTSP